MPRKNRFLSKKFVIFAILGAIGLLLYSCLHHHQQKQLVISEKVHRGNITAQVTASGKLQAFEKTPVGAQTSGEIKHLYVEIGDQVKKGQLIAELDPTVPLNNLAKAKDTLIAAQADLNILNHQLTVAKADLNSFTHLYHEGASSKAEYNRYLSTYQDTRNRIIQAKAKIHTAQLEVKNMSQSLSYTKIKAPMDGTVISLPVSVGQTLAASLDTPVIAQIAQLNKMKIKVEISEGDIYQVQPGQQAIFTISGNPDRYYSAVVKTVYPASINTADNSKGSSSNSYHAILEVSSVDQNFRVDMTAIVTIITGQKENVLTISNTAINKENHKTFVTVLGKNNQPIKREVTIGFSNGILSEVVSGLQEGETVLKETVKTE